MNGVMMRMAEVCRSMNKMCTEEKQKQMYVMCVCVCVGGGVGWGGGGGQGENSSVCQISVLHYKFQNQDFFPPHFLCSLFQLIIMNT